MKRSRGRNRRSGGNQQNAFNNPNRHFESVGPDVKIRGSAQQVLEKYQQYARDAQTSGDRILSEAYFQYAEHYQRIVAKQQEARNQQQQQHQNRGGGNGPRDDRDPRSGQDRDPRGGQNDDGAQMGEDEGEAEVVPAAVSRRNEDADSDSLRVIDAEDDGDEAEASAPAERAERSQGEPRDKGNRRGSRKPYKAREDRPAREPAAEAVPEIDGVMKTLSRGRRKLTPEESPAEQD